MGRLDARCTACFKKSLQPFVLEAFDHVMKCSLSRVSCQNPALKITAVNRLTVCE